VRVRVLVEAFARFATALTPAVAAPATRTCLRDGLLIFSGMKRLCRP
jgi:hypothetical protein